MNAARRQTPSLPGTPVTRLVVLATLAMLLAAAAPDRDGAAGGSIAAAIGAGALDISTLAEGSDGEQLTWASWTEGAPDRWITRLVLVRPTASGAAITWGVQRPDGYGAVLRPTLWQVHGRPILILQYQFGAAYTRMELYAARPDAQASMLDSVEGAWIDVQRQGAQQTLRAHDTADLRGAPRCYRWDERAEKLGRMACGPPAR